VFFNLKPREFQLMHASLGRRWRLGPIALALLAGGASVTARAQATAGAPDDAAVPTLEQVNVRDKYEREDLPHLAPGRKAAKGARLGILGATSIVDAPMHVNAYTRELAEDWSALTLQDVLENDSAVVFTTNQGHLLQNFNLRGLDVSAMDIATNGLYGIAPANSVPIEMFERVEVLRGPNVLLSGMPPNNSVAGTVNMVTKRALGQILALVLAAHVDLRQRRRRLRTGLGARFAAGRRRRLGHHRGSGGSGHERQHDGIEPQCAARGFFHGVVHKVQKKRYRSRSRAAA